MHTHSSTLCKHEWPCQHTLTQGQYNKSIIGCKSSVWAPLYHTPTPLSPPPCCHGNKDWRLLSVFCCAGSSRSTGPHRTAWRKSKSFVVFMRIILRSPFEQKENKKKDYETYCVDIKLLMKFLVHYHYTGLHIYIYIYIYINKYICFFANQQFYTGGLGKKKRFT